MKRKYLPDTLKSCAFPLTTPKIKPVDGVSLLLVKEKKYFLFCLNTSNKKLTESELKSLVEIKTGKKIAEWIYEDFDGNGTKEAFAVIGSQEYVEDQKTFVYIWFINNKGIITVSGTGIFLIEDFVLHCPI